MDTGQRDLAFTRGDDYTHTFTFTDNADPPVALNLAGRTFTAQLRQFEDDPAAIDFVVDDTDLATGVLVLSLPATSTASLGRSYAWDMEMVDTDSKVVTVLAGTVTVTLDVTRGGS